MPGQLLAGRYELTRLLARGGMADVWQGTDTLLERQVAVKILHPHLAADHDFVARFRTEAVAAARLHHRSIVAIFDTCSENGVEAIVMELIRGHTLREEFDAHGPMDPAAVIALGAEVADALEASHRAGLIHRDIKPPNILVCDDHRVMVTDFGIAKIQDVTDRTLAGTMLGSVKYLSPEQVEGQPVDARSDVYALGVVLYEALTGKVPFIADSPAATALARLHTVPVRPRVLRPGVPVALDDVVMRALARDPDDRHPSAQALRDALLAARAVPDSVDPDRTDVAPRPTPVAAPPSTGSVVAAPRAMLPPPRPVPKRRWGVLIAALVLCLTGLVVAGLLVLRSDAGQHLADSVLPHQGTTTPATTLRLSARAFDPSGDGGEVDNLVPNAIDGNPATAWHTEYYMDRKFSSNPNKTGVGLIIDLNERVPIGRVKVSSPTQNWAAQIYVSDTSPASLAEWGEPVTGQEGIAGDADFDLAGHEGQYVLLWITDLGTGPLATPTPPNVTVQISDITVETS